MCNLQKKFFSEHKFLEISCKAFEKKICGLTCQNKHNKKRGILYTNRTVIQTLVFS